MFKPGLQSRSRRHIKDTSTFIRFLTWTCMFASWSVPCGVMVEHWRWRKAGFSVNLPCRKPSASFVLFPPPKLSSVVQLSLQLGIKDDPMLWCSRLGHRLCQAIWTDFLPAGSQEAMLMCNLMSWTLPYTETSGQLPLESVWKRGAFAFQKILSRCSSKPSIFINRHPTTCNHRKPDFQSWHETPVPLKDIRWRRQ